MKNVKSKSLTIICVTLLMTSVFGITIGDFVSREGQKTRTILVKDPTDKEVNLLNKQDIKVLDEYGSYLLVDVSGEKTIESLERTSLEIDTLPNRTDISVKGHGFDIFDEEPRISSDLKLESYKPGEEGRYIVHMLGPINPEWRESLENKDVNIINYVPNYAYEVTMTPEKAEKIKEFSFVDWVGIYHPGYKLQSDIDPDIPVNVQVRSQLNKNKMLNINSKLSRDSRIISIDDNPEKGFHMTINVSSEESLKDLARMRDVYYISQQVEPKLHDEIATQITGGGSWLIDNDDNSYTPYREYGDHGSYINQLGYTGKNVTVAVADTGIYANHSDFQDRVIGGYSYTENEDNWTTGNLHYHGTHCAGSVAGDTYNGTGMTINEFSFSDELGPYYAAQGSAPQSELYAVRIFGSSAGWVGPDDIYDIVEVAAQNSTSYIHSNSWGAAVEGEYTAMSNSYDIAVRDANSNATGNQPMVITTSAGNSGPGDGTVGTPATAKNVITVGSTENFLPDFEQFDGAENPDKISGFSSRGWTVDNRIKPDVVAPGEEIISTGPDSEDHYMISSGTSMANPNVAGASAVIVDWYKANYGKKPSPAMVKSLLINSAYDLDEDNGNTKPIPNKKEGWGMVDLSKLQYPKNNPVPYMLKDQTSLITTGEQDKYVVTPKQADKPLNITLTWTDEEAEPGDNPTLKNDLNLEIVTPEGKVYRGNAFDNDGDGVSDSGYSYPNTDAMDVFDTNGDGWDNVNNVENVYIPAEDVKSGVYTVRVKGHNIPADSNNDGQANQDYALSVYNSKDFHITTDRKRYSSEDKVEVTVKDKDLKKKETLKIGAYSDTQPEGINLTLEGDENTYYFTGNFTISEKNSDSVLQVSHKDQITVEYWDETQATIITANAFVDGKPPKPPGNFEVDWYGHQSFSLFDDDVEQGNIGYITKKSHSEASNWSIRENGASTGNSSWDFGNGQYNKTSEHGMKSSLISPTIKIPEYVVDATLTFDHWRSFNNLWDGGNVKISTKGTDGPWNPITPEKGYDGVIEDAYGNPLGGQKGWANKKDWEKVTFDLSDYVGKSIHIRWDVGVEAYDKNYGEGWRIDNITVIGENWNGTQHNRLSWSPSPSEHVVKYNIYRAKSPEGPWNQTNLLTSVSGDSTEYVDNFAGKADDVKWWYIVRAEEDVGLEEKNNLMLSEPGDPTLNITSPTKGEIVGGNVNVSWNGSSSIDNYSIRLNDGELINVNESTQYTFENLSDGDYLVSVFGYTDNETGFDSITFTVDTLPPSLDITYPKNEGYAHSNNVTVEWNTNDIVSGVDYSEIKFNGTWFNVSSDTSYTIPNLEHGETYNVSVKVWDNAGHNSSEDIKFTIDTTKPEINISSPTNDQLLDTKDIVVSWTGSDDISGISHYELKIDGNDWIDVGESNEYTIEDLTDGGHTVQVRAYNGAGQSTTDSVSFKTDTTPPDLEISNIETNEIIKKEEVLVEWNSSDEASGIDHYEIQLDNNNWIEIGKTTQYTFSGIEDGEHSINIRAWDNASQSSNERVTFTVDTQYPVVEIGSPSESSLFTTDSMTVTWYGYDNTTGIEHYEIKLDQGEWFEVGTATAHTLTGLTDDEHTVKIKAVDTAGLNSTDNITFEVDTESPMLKITQPTNGLDNLTYDESFIIEGQTNTNAKLTINGEKVELDSNGKFVYETSLVKGLNPFKVVATDEVGHKSVKIVYALHMPDIPELDKEIDGLQSDIESINNDITDLNEQLTYLESDLEENVTEFENEIININSDMTELKQELDALRSYLEENVTALENDLDEQGNDIDKIGDNIATLEDQISNIKDEISTLQEEADTLEQGVETEIPETQNELKEGQSDQNSDISLARNIGIVGIILGIIAIILAVWPRFKDEEESNEESDEKDTFEEEMPVDPELNR